MSRFLTRVIWTLLLAGSLRSAWGSWNRLQSQSAIRAEPVKVIRHNQRQSNDGNKGSVRQAVASHSRPNNFGPSRNGPPPGPPRGDFPVSTGPCADPPLITNFDLRLYLGRWFEIQRFFAPFQSGDCVTADYSINPNCSVNVANSNVVEGRLDTIIGSAVSGPDPTRGELVVNFPNQPPQFTATEPNYGVVATDYRNFAVVYSCREFAPGQKFEYSWILGRKPNLSDEFLENLKQWLKQVGIQVDRYMPTNQLNCLRRYFRPNKY